MLLPACSGLLSNKYAAELASPSDASAATGMVILSAGALESCHPSINVPTHLLIYEANDSFFRTEKALLEVDSTFMDSEFQDHHGHLYILKLPVGSYYLTPRAFNPFAPFAGYLFPSRADFEVAANQTTYLGEFYMDNECGNRAKLILRDQEARDLAMLKSKNAAFRDIPVAKRLLQFTGCDRFSLICTVPERTIPATSSP